jgi:hypothetical protein
MHHDRAAKVLSGTPEEQAAEAVALLVQRGALTAATPDPAVLSRSDEAVVRDAGRGRMIAVLTEPDRPQVGAELLATAARLCESIGGHVHALAFGGADTDALGAAGADAVTTLRGTPNAEDVAAAVVAWSAQYPLWALLGPSTAFGREVLGRAAAALGAGLVGDAVGIEVVDDELVAAKPAFSGALLADIVCTSDVRLVSVRPGVLPLPSPREGTPALSSWPPSRPSPARFWPTSCAPRTSGWSRSVPASCRYPRRERAHLLSPRGRCRRAAGCDGWPSAVTTTSKCWRARTW